ncbi:MAG: B12-binding domain-containing protein, partial [Desulfitobacteriaceae bacterium]|nr:B12-binding domain-containing protein [Desulfitobacteriaceae bacterium]
MTYNYSAIVESILGGNASAVKEQVNDALAQGSDPVEIISRGLVAAMDSVGTKFEHNEIYVTELLVTARAMHAGLEEMRPYMTATNTPPTGRVILGTVAGDLHDIG